jgi:hypothetical protein
MEATRDTEELAPNDSYLRPLRVVFPALAGIGVLAALAWFGSRGNATNWEIALALTLLPAGGVGSVVFWLWFANARLLIGPGVVGFRNLFGQRRFWPVSDITRVVDLTILYVNRYGTQPKLFTLLLGPDGRCLFKLKVAAWRGDDIAALVAATGRSHEYAGVYTTARQQGSSRARLASCTSTPPGPLSSQVRSCLRSALWSSGPT